MLCHSITLHTKTKCLFGQISIGNIFRRGFRNDIRLFFIRGKINSFSIAISNNRHHLRRHSARFAFGANVVERRDCRTNQTSRAAPVNWANLILDFRLRILDFKANRFPFGIYDGRHINFLAFFRRKRERAHQRHHRAARRIRTFHRPRPQPRDHRQILDFRFRILDFFVGRVSKFAVVILHGFDFRIKMPDAFFGFVAHPFAVVTHVFR